MRESTMIWVLIVSWLIMAGSMAYVAAHFVIKFW